VDHIANGLAHFPPIFVQRETMISTVVGSSRVFSRISHTSSVRVNPRLVRHSRISSPTLLSFAFTGFERRQQSSIHDGLWVDHIANGLAHFPPIFIQRETKKQLENPEPVYDALGPDALRMWAASSDYTRDVVHP
jgi:hypothetical protein